MCVAVPQGKTPSETRRRNSQSSPVFPNIMKSVSVYFVSEGEDNCRLLYLMTL
jgi:hypothetical protein